MKDFFKLLIPQKLEVFVFSLFGFIFILLVNVQNFWAAMTSQTVYVTTPKINPINDWLIGIQSNINPKIIDFIVWLLIGSLVFILASTIMAMVKNTEDEVEILHYYRTPKGRGHEAVAYLTKIAVRIAGILGLIVWLDFFIYNFNPWLTKIFYSSVTNLNDFSSWLWVFLTIFFMSICIYVCAIFIRISALKIRIFAKDQE